LFVAAFVDRDVGLAEGEDRTGRLGCYVRNTRAGLGGSALVKPALGCDGHGVRPDEHGVCHLDDLGRR
jgi:hypothetical protein